MKLKKTNIFRRGYEKFVKLLKKKREKKNQEEAALLLQASNDTLIGPESTESLLRVIPYSPFLHRAPYEIRRHIFADLFGREAIHLIQRGAAITTIRCNKKAPRPNKICTELGMIPLEMVSLEVNVLRVCKQIHREASEVLYSGILFVANNFRGWNVFAQVIGPRNLALVQNLQATWVSLRNPMASRRLSSMPFVHLNDWDDERSPYESTFSGAHYEKFWDTLALKMPALRNLTIKMNYPTEALQRSVNAVWIQPLRRVRGLHNFDLHINDRYHTLEDNDEQEEARFFEELRLEMCQPQEDSVTE